MKKLSVLAVAVILLCTAFYFYSYHNTDLRGWWRKSHDGKSYLVVNDPDGGNCPPIYVDGLPVSAGVGERIEIEPGEHKITCRIESDKRQGVGFFVESGVEYHFDYWGP